MPPTQVFQSSIDVAGQLLTSGNHLVRLLLSLAIILLALLTRKVLQRVIVRQNLPAPTTYFWTKLVSYGIAFLVILFIGSIWLYGFGNAATFLGLLSAGLALALREPIVNLAGWIFILLRRPLVLGDRIELENIKGDVIDLGPFFFTVLEIGNWIEAEQNTGRIIYIPNAKVFTVPIANYTQQFPYIWDEIPVLITFESNWQKAKTILTTLLEQDNLTVSGLEKETLRRTASHYYIKLGKLTPTVYTSVVSSGVQLTMRFLTPVRQRRGMEQHLWEAILNAFAQEDDIDLAYDTQRVFYNPREGKPGTGGPKPQPTQASDV